MFKAEVLCYYIVSRAHCFTDPVANNVSKICAVNTNFSDPFTFSVSFGAANTGIFLLQTFLSAHLWLCG